MGIGILPITLECLEGMVSFTGRGHMIVKAPKDMKVLAAHVKPELNQIWLKVESPDIEAVETGKMLPFVEVTMANIRPAPAQAKAEKSPVAEAKPE